MHITYNSVGAAVSWELEPVHCITTLYPRYNLIQLCTMTSMPTLLQFLQNRIGTSIKI